MLGCWAYEASDRPNFPKIVSQLSEILALASDYLSFDMTFSPASVGGLQDQVDQMEGHLAESSPTPLLQSEEEEGEEGVLENHTLTRQDLELRTGFEQKGAGNLEPDVI